MSAISRSWLAFAAAGVGIIHCALIIGAPVGLALPLGILGILELGWGLLAFTRDQLPAPRAAIVVALAPLVAWGALVAAASTFHIGALGSVLDVAPWGIAAVLQLFVAGSLARHFRRVSDGTDATASAPSVARYITALVVGALVVFVLTLTALATINGPATEGNDVDDLFDIPSHVGH
ncbi:MULTISPECIES: hypothetical protein [unclassified Salinibacterium]|uniref:hypothetical protein n=1 Tax=unclassified Salinibacterium TaxID=2632331 RepID=UPI0018CF7DA9|nr:MULTISPECIES: hypothetical protein [unclassified Salinibacterium]MBH0052843.1 hypothetical protein [Salinibacterium sp. SWN139]MBH0082104.1 hypothetical protein [Salinibacterium sp. SWN167]